MYYTITLTQTICLKKNVVACKTKYVILTRTPGV